MKGAGTFRTVLIAGCCVPGLLAGSHANAQQTVPEAAPGQIETVTVTAERRAENIQKVPIPITAVSADTAAKEGVLMTDQLADAVPGMVFGHEINGATAFIRGIGPNSNGTGEESSVAMYLDDLYIEQGDASIFNLNDIDSVQVLKGPQGTLFGRNATGGVIQVLTKNPTDTPAGDLQVGYANYATTTGNAYFTGGVTDNLAANLAIYGSNQQDGWGRDIYTGQPSFTSEDWGIRNKWLWTPTSTTTVLLSASFMYTRGEVGLGFNQVPSWAATGGHGFCPGEGPPPAFACPAGEPGAPYAGFYNTTDIRNDVAVNKHELVELKVTQNFDVATVVDIAGFQRMDGYANFNQDASIYGDVVTDLFQTGRDFSNEFQVLSPDNAPYSDWLKQWIFGFYYLHDISGYGGPSGGARLQGLSFGLPVQFVPPSFYLDLNDGVYTTSYAGYGQATVQIFPATDIVFGARYTSDNRIFTGGLFTSPALGGATIINTQPDDPGANRTWDMVSYRAQLTHQWTDDVLTFLSFDRGEKSGQFDTFGTAATGPVITPPVNPEVLLSYQAGIKSQWLDNRLQLNATAFHYDVKNLQFAIIVPGGTELINAAAATENGGEIEGTWIPITNVTLSSGLSILYGHYSSFDNAPDYFVPGCTPTGPILCKINASGADMVRAPHYTWNFGIDYETPTTVGDFDWNVNYTYTDTFQWFPDGSLQQPATNLVNASVTWTMPNGKIDVRLWAANITGDEYYSFGSESYGLGKQFSPEAPRTYGITLGAHL